MRAIPGIPSSQNKTVRTLLFHAVLCIALVQILFCPASATILTPKFTANVTSGSIPLSVSFTDVSEDSPDHWAWFFGDEDQSRPWVQGDTAAWILVSEHAGWKERSGLSSVVLADGRIVIMGGLDKDNGFRNDVWQSVDSGSTWSPVTTSAEWAGRNGHSSVVLRDGTIVLMGGRDSHDTYLNDIWRSSDNGSTWSRVMDHAAWKGRYGHSSVVMPNGNIILMGGTDDSGHNKNDVWRSTDNGTTWNQVAARAEWAERAFQTSVAKPDGSIILMGGNLENGNVLEDVWRSPDYGKTWVCQNIHNNIWNEGRWEGRWAHSSVVLPDGSILIIGGWMARLPA